MAKVIESSHVENSDTSRLIEAWEGHHYKMELYQYRPSSGYCYSCRLICFSDDREGDSFALSLESTPYSSCLTADFSSELRLNFGITNPQMDAMTFRDWALWKAGGILGAVTGEVKLMKKRERRMRGNIFKKLKASFGAKRLEYASDKAVDGLTSQVRIGSRIYESETALTSVLLSDFSLGYIHGFAGYFIDRVTKDEREYLLNVERVIDEVLGWGTGRLTQVLAQRLLFHVEPGTDIPLLSKRIDQIQPAFRRGHEIGRQEAIAFGASDSNRPRGLSDFFIQHDDTHLMDSSKFRVALSTLDKAPVSSPKSTVQDIQPLVTHLLHCINRRPKVLYSFHILTRPDNLPDDILNKLTQYGLKHQVACIPDKGNTKMYVISSNVYSDHALPIFLHELVSINGVHEVRKQNVKHLETQ